jgi:transcription elongation GreA/GreB family factor
MNNEIKIELKKHIFNICFELLIEKRNHYEKEMKDIQYEANQFKGAMESRYDTFKEELQERKNNISIQYAKVLEELSNINKIKIIEQKTVGLGSVVKTKDENGIKTNYFIFSNISTKPLIINGVNYFLLNLESPIGSVLKGKSENDELVFRGKKILITEII